MEPKKKLLKEQVAEDHEEDLRREARDRIDAQQQADAEEEAQQKQVHGKQKTLKSFHYHANEDD